MSDHAHDHAHGDATVVALGAVTAGGTRFAVDREGEPEAGAACTFGVERVDGGGATPTEAWIVDPRGDVISDETVGEGHDEHWHFAITPYAGYIPSAFVLRAAAEDSAGCCYGSLMGAVEESAPLALATGAAPRHGGILAAGLTRDGEDAGFVELKLHDDLGDLELWLSAAADGSPLDVPAGTSVTLTFASHEGKTVELRIRNDDKNEDEDGVANMRAGRTNYFIFPDKDQDATWLKGADWRGVVEVSFESEGAWYVCPAFVLVPHSVL